MNVSIPSESLRADIPLPHLCHYLKQMPPPHQQPLIHLYLWTLEYALPTDQKVPAAQPFQGLPARPDSAHQLFSYFRDREDNCQGILTHPLHVEAWARCHILLADCTIQGESTALSQARWHYVSPLQWQAAQRKQTAYEQRVQALALMQQRKSQNP